MIFLNQLTQRKRIKKKSRLTFTPSGVLHPFQNVLKLGVTFHFAFTTICQQLGYVTHISLPQLQSTLGGFRQSHELRVVIGLKIYNTYMFKYYQFEDYLQQITPITCKQIKTETRCIRTFSEHSKHPKVPKIKIKYIYIEFHRQAKGV